MNKIIILLLVTFSSTLALADGNSKLEKYSEIVPKSAQFDENNSFNVGGLSACVGEFDDEDAVADFAEFESSTSLEKENCETSEATK